MEIKAKIIKWDLLKLKSFCTIKEMMDKMKRDWEKTFANDVTNKELSLQNLQIMILNSIKINNPLNKWTKDLNGHFSKEDIQMDNRHMKRCSTSLVIREMQIKTTMRYHLTQVRMAIIKQSTKKQMLERV